MENLEQKIIEKIAEDKRRNEEKTLNKEGYLSSLFNLKDHLSSLAGIVMDWFRSNTIKVKEVDPIKKITVLNFPKYQKIKGRVEVKKWNELIEKLSEANSKLDGLIKKPEFKLPPVQKVEGRVKTDIKIPKYPDFPKEIKVNNLKSVKDELEKVKKAIKSIKFPPFPRPEKFPTEISVNNLSDLYDHFDTLVTLLAMIEAKEIEIPDNTELIDEIKKVQIAISSLEFPIPPTQTSAYQRDGKKESVELTDDGDVPVSSVFKAQAFRTDATSTADVTYLGWATPGTTTSSASWKIAKVDESSDAFITWADGNANYDNVWDDRVSLSYS